MPVLKNLTSTGMCQQILVQILRTEFHNNQSSASWIIPCEWTARKDGQIYSMDKPTVVDLNKIHLGQMNCILLKRRGINFRHHLRRNDWCEIVHDTFVDKRLALRNEPPPPKKNFISKARRVGFALNIHVRSVTRFINLLPFRKNENETQPLWMAAPLQHAACSQLTLPIANSVPGCTTTSYSPDPVPWNFEGEKYGEEDVKNGDARYDPSWRFMARDVSEKFQSQRHRPLEHRKPAQSL
jgi:hypothetical protein